MKYLYYPGCSLKSTGRPYEESLLATFEAIGTPLTELDDWNCCGATAYMAVSELKAFALCARNFALAERQNGSEAPQLVVPCAACYLGLVKAQHYMNDYPKIRGKVQKGLAAAGLEYNGSTQVRHPLDVLLRDIGPKTLAEKCVRPLKGLKVACYYGCQLVRPFALFDNQHEPTTMDELMKTMGAETIDWPLKTRCCGGALTGTIQDVGLRLSHIILTEAVKRGCDVIATACPLCQFNLECYQKEMSHRFEEKVNIPVVYFTQLMGLAMGVEPRKLGMQRLFVPFDMKSVQATKEVAAHV
jgi:heterodisulfide reductase subunit B2